MSREYAPTPPKVAVTKKQMKQIEKNYQKAAARAEDHSETEAHEKQKAMERIEDRLKDTL